MDELLAAAPAATAKAVLALYPPTETYEARIERFTDFSLIRTFTWPGYGWPGEAAHLCVDGSWHETAAERLLDRERGCLLVIASEWGAYLGAAPGSTEAGQHYDAARTILGYARKALGTAGARWLDRTLARNLPRVASQIRPWTDDIKRGTRKPSVFMRTSPASVTSVQLLTVVRDADASNLRALAATEMRGPSVFGGPSFFVLPEGTQAQLATGRLPHVSGIGACLHDVEPLQALPRGQTFEGAAGPFSDSGRDCSQAIVTFWNRYRNTGAAKDYAAAVAVLRYAGFAGKSPRDFSLIAELEDMLR